MKLRAEAVRSFLPFLIGCVVRGKMRLPESNVAHAADTEHEDEACTFCLQRGDLFGVGGKVGLRRKVALARWHRQVAEFVEECFLHAVLERGGIGRIERVALAVRPFIHVEGRDMVAGDVPLLQEEGSPAVHAHGADRQDQRQLDTLVAGFFNLQRDLVAHVGVEIMDIFALDGLKVRVPPVFARHTLVAACIDLCHVPAFRVEALKKGTFNRTHEIHNRSSLKIVF